MFSDLECDYINPIDLCNKLNQVSQTYIVISFVLRHLHPYSLFCRKMQLTHSSPCCSSSLANGSRFYSIYRLFYSMQTSNGFSFLCWRMNIDPFSSRIRSKAHWYDATEIFRSLSGHKQETFIKLGFYLLSFFYYLYRCACSFGERPH